jgi:DNA-binding MarR family transcriptional regulator
MGKMPAMSPPRGTRVATDRTDRPSDGQVDAVLAALRALVGIAAASIAEVDDVVTVPQLRVLVMLHTRGSMNLAAVAAALEVNPSNASRTCDRLSKVGLLDRRDLPTDRRHVTLTITGKGRQLVDKVIRHRRAAIERALCQMPAPQRERLAEDLSAFAAAAGEPLDELLTLVWPPTR